MKILHISKYYHPFRGGIEKVIMELAEGCVSSGHEVRVLCSNETSKNSHEILNGVEVVRLSRPAVLFSQPLTLGIFFELKKHLQWADVVHVHTPNPLAELAMVLHSCDKPVITTYHCDVVRQKLMTRIYRPVAHKMLGRSDHIVVSTPNHLKYSEPLKAFLDKCKVIPFGVRAKHANKTVGIEKELAKIKNEIGEYFLFVGRLVPYKGVDVLLRAMKSIQQKLVIIGKGPRWEAWNELAKKEGVDSKVHFLGQVDTDDQFAAYIHGCESLVLPSLDESEAFGIVLIEAMSCGKPIITTRLKSGVPWVNHKGVSGLEVEPGEVEPLAGAMNQLAQNDLLRTQMGRAARERFENLFQVETMVQAYCNIYQESLVPFAKTA